MKPFLLVVVAGAASDECSLSFGENSFCDRLGICGGTDVSCEYAYNSVPWVEPLPFLENGCLNQPTILVDYEHLQGGVLGVNSLRSFDPLAASLMQWVAPTARELFIASCVRD